MPIIDGNPTNENPSSPVTGVGKSELTPEQRKENILEAQLRMLQEINRRVDAVLKSPHSYEWDDQTALQTKELINALLGRFPDHATVDDLKRRIPEGLHLLDIYPCTTDSTDLRLRLAYSSDPDALKSDKLIIDGTSRNELPRASDFDPPTDDFSTVKIVSAISSPADAGRLISLRLNSPYGKQTIVDIQDPQTATSVGTSTKDHLKEMRGVPELSNSDMTSIYKENGLMYRAVGPSAGKAEGLDEDLKACGLPRTPPEVRRETFTPRGVVRAARQRITGGLRQARVRKAMRTKRHDKKLDKKGNQRPTTNRMGR